jgi:protein-ribulosamine 3-kinase
MLPQELIDALALYLPAPIERTGGVSGGCIHRAVRLDTAAGSYFLKYNRLDHGPMFATELRGLQMLAETQTVPIAAPIATGTTAHHAFLLLQWIEAGPRKARFWEDFGQGLAALHRHAGAVPRLPWASRPHTPTYGLDHDNFIGSLPQSNTPCTNGAEFFHHQRLAPQLRLAQANGLADATLARQFESLFLRLPHLIPDTAPSLLHGDLWSGNFMTNAQGEATLIDPAVYYGHREADLAFTRLFGGFQPAFYHAYEEAWPLEPGWQSRTDLFNLYPLMVHLNLFGRSYLPDIQQTLRKYA